MMSVRDLLACGRRASVVLFVFLSYVSVATGQTAASSEQHQHPPPAADPSHVPEQREGSGTSWLPDATPMYALHDEYGEWELMGHGNIFLQYFREGGTRGDEQFGSVNWAMGMARRRLGEGRLGVRAMLSLEPWTIGGCGYPDLLASGEVCDGRAIVDRQHPHDFMMELAATYDRPLTDVLALQLYGGLAGEPALGPVAFPHRTSAMPNPVAPLSHHWLDSTHITYGVLTGGIYGRQWKLEGSIFNGREPDDERHDFDVAALDSFSARAWFLPTDRLALQISAGRLTEAEADDEGGPREDVTRVTGSATYHRAFRDGASIWASTFALGRNVEQDESTGFMLAETNVTFDEQDAYFGRFEIGRKSAHDLGVPDAIGEFTIGKMQAGYVRYFDTGNSLRPGVGATASISIVPSALTTAYGNRATFGFGVFVTVRPAAMSDAR